MGTFLSILVKVLSTDAVKTLIGLIINKLLTVSGDGITSDIAKVMIDGIVASKANPTTADVFASAVDVLKGATNGL